VASPARPAGANDIRYCGRKRVKDAWTGRGQMPKWLRILADAGHDKESFAILKDNGPDRRRPSCSRRERFSTTRRSIW